MNLDFSAYQQRYPFKIVFRNWWTLKELKGMIALFFVPVALIASGLQWYLRLPNPFESDGYWGLVVFILGLGFLGFYSWLVLKLHERTKNRLRLKNFATENNFTYSETANNLKLDGVLFRSGNIPEKNRVYDLLTGSYEGKNIAVGNRHFEMKAPRHNIQFDYGFLSIQLDKKLPQMILRSKKKGMELTLGYTKNQVQSLEGDFDDHFTLFTQDGHKTDALYVLTPDVMALLIDYAADYDIEITGDHIYFYARQFDLSEALFRQLFEIVDVVGTKTKRQTKRFTDATSNQANGLQISNPAVWSIATTTAVIIGTLLRFYFLIN